MENVVCRNAAMRSKDRLCSRQSRKSAGETKFSSPLRSCSQSMTSRSGWRYGRGCRRTAFTMLKMAELARMGKILEQLENQKTSMMEIRMKNGNHCARLLANVTGVINQ